MAQKESAEHALLRWDKLKLVQEEYAEFDPFLDDVMALLGFDTSPVQHDIGKFLSYGPDYLMIQAQRGQAKTTITAAYAVWSLIHQPNYRILIVSAGGTQASEISTLIVKIIMTMELLECLRPDASNGDRTSVEKFDIHYTLKGIDKSPSVACVGITGNLQGKRADLLIADDIESLKNSRTPTMRELLLEQTRDFTSICSTGRIVYLGTPQSQDSIYNTLPSRGFIVRIWPGRFPNPEQVGSYGEHLAPWITRCIEHNPALAFGGGPAGDQGQPIDPAYLTEAVLTKKQLDQGSAYFQLQHMLNTALSDAMRYPLKVDKMVVMRMGIDGYHPLTVIRSMTADKMKDYSVANFNFKLSTPHEISDDVSKLQGTVMYVDPAGGGKNGDETGYAVTGFLNGNVYLLACGGVPGGYRIEVMQQLAGIAKRWRVNKLIIEKNMGYGAFREILIPEVRKEWECSVEDDYVHGQKELRIIETLEPVIERGSLIINESVVEEDLERLQIHEGAQRQVYSLFYQMAKITRDRLCLVHDDRLDALEGAVRYWTAQLAINQQAAIQRARAAEHKAWADDPLMQKSRFKQPQKSGSIMNRFRR